MSDEEDNGIVIDIDDGEEEEAEGMDYDLNDLAKQCENIEPKVQERKRENQRQKFDSASYEKERQEKKKK